MAPLNRARTLGLAPEARRGSSDTIRDLLACGMWANSGLGRPATGTLAVHHDGTLRRIPSGRAEAWKRLRDSPIKRPGGIAAARRGRYGAGLDLSTGILASIAPPGTGNAMTHAHGATSAPEP